MEKFTSEREAFLFGQRQIGLVPDQFHKAFLRGAHDKAKKEERQSNFLFLDPKVEEAYKKLLSVWKTQAAVARAIGVSQGNLSHYLSGRMPVGPKVKARFLLAARSVTDY